MISLKTSVYPRHDVQYGDIDTMERGLDFTFDPDKFGKLPDYVNKMRDDYNMHYVIILVRSFHHQVYVIVSITFVLK